MKRAHYLIIGVVILILSAIGLSMYGYQIRIDAEKMLEREEERKATEIANKKAFTEQTFKQLRLQADAVYVKNLITNEVVFESNSHQPLPLASLVKIMTAITALRLVDKHTTITFSPQAIAQIGDQGFKPGESVSLNDLIPFMLVTSSNDAGFAIAETVQKATGIPFTTSMNKDAQALGFHSFVFNSPTGLDDTIAGIQASATGSAVDVSDLLLYATQHYPDYFSTSTATMARINGHKGINTNTLTNSIPGFLASKTGFTTTAGGNLAFIVEIGPNQPYSVVIMGSSFEGRFKDARKIIEALYTVVGGAPSDL